MVICGVQAGKRGVGTADSYDKPYRRPFRPFFCVLWRKPRNTPEGYSAYAAARTRLAYGCGASPHALQY